METRMPPLCRPALLTVLALLAPAVSGAQTAEDEFFYTLDDASYDTADGACHAYYDSMSAKLPAEVEPGFSVLVRPYRPPVLAGDSTENHVYYRCLVDYVQSYRGKSFNFSASALIYKLRKSCPAGQPLNVLTETCEQPSDEQPRKEMGDPGQPLLGGVSVCVGNPASASTGNKYQEEEDYRDADGGLRLVRYYNGLSGEWGANYDKMLYFDPYGRGLALFHGDGRQSLFAWQRGVATPEATEQGSLKQVGTRWVYDSPDNEQYRFDARGRMVAWRLADGQVQTLAYADKGSGALTVTVTDASGHNLQLFVANGALARMKAGKLTVTYKYDKSNRLSKVTRAWPGHASSRGYLYEDQAHPKALTGIIDERGVRYASWKYDAAGRVVSSEHAGGADKVSLAYHEDGSTTVSNALGHAVTYRHKVIHGIKRVTAIEGEPAAGCPAGNTAYTYTERGQVAARIDALGNVTAYSYDAMGREIRRVEALGSPVERTTSTSWDATRFLPLTVTTSDRVITYTYDNQGRPLSTSVHATKE